jgi:hypothetical protein
MTTASEVKSAAELERLRLATQAARARAATEAQARQAEGRTAAQAYQAKAETERQAQAAKAEAAKEAKARQAEIRKQRGQAEKEAEAAKGKARKAERIERRKVVLPVSKPRDLGLTSYISGVETARKQAHKAGASAKAAVAKVRDDYFEQVDKARDTAIADIKRQKAGVIRDIQEQLVDINADITKQLANANSGVDAWEKESKAKIAKAQAEYEAAIKAALNRSGTEVFADMKDKGLIPSNAIYDSYDKTTGQLNYTTPDTRSGQEIFADLQSQNEIPPTAKYKSYDSDTGEVSYVVETPNFGSNIFRNMQNAGKIPKDATFVSYNSEDKTVTYFVTSVGTTTIAKTTSATPTPDSSVTTSPSSTMAGTSQNSMNVVGAVAGTAAMGAAAISIPQAVGTGLVIFPEPITSIIGAIILGVATYFTARKIKEVVESKKETTATSDAVVTNKDGTAAYSIQQYTFTPQAKGQSTTSVPLEQAESFDIKDYLPNIKPAEEKLILEQERIEARGIPKTKEQPVVMIRDRFNVPELQQKASNVLAAAAALEAATKTIPMTREQWDRVEEALRQGKVAEGKRIIEGLAKKADSPEIARRMTQAYRDYLRKKAILDEARKAYVASLNPQPVKGKGSADATAAAIGIWLAQDIIQGRIAKALRQGKSLSQAMDEAQAEIKEVSKQLGLTQQQISAATATVVYQVALSSMAQAAVQASSQAQAQNLSATQTQTKTMTATKAAAKTAVQSAVATQTLTLSQAAELAQELNQVAESVATTTANMKLPKLPKGAKGMGQKEYPDGTIAFKMGETRRGEEYKIIPPPYTMLKPISSKYPPKGMTKTKGTPQETLTFIGDKVPFHNVSFDLGVTDGFIDVKAKKIRFTGGGEKTNVGTRIESTTKGVSLANNKALTKPRIERVSNKPRRGKLVSHGVYADKSNRRITRKRHRGWRRIY